jgi:hypothetical protein
LSCTFLPRYEVAWLLMIIIWIPATGQILRDNNPTADNSL